MALGLNEFSVPTAKQLFETVVEISGRLGQNAGQQTGRSSRVVE